MPVYKVTRLHGLDILLTVVFIEHFVEQFKGLSCSCASLGAYCPSAWFGWNIPPPPNFCLFTWSCCWQVNGAQHLTSLQDIQSDLIQPLVFVRGYCAVRMLESLAAHIPAMLHLLCVDFFFFLTELCIWITAQCLHHGLKWNQRGQ